MKIPSQNIIHFDPLMKVPDLNLEGIDRVIVGGESGRTPRPIKEDWVIEIKEQCQTAKVAFYFKQWGGTNKKKTGKVLEGKVYNQMPETI
jgi:protein gp37